MTRSIAQDVDLLGRCLGTVIAEQEGRRVLELEEHVRLRAKALRERGADGSDLQETLAALAPHDAALLVRASSRAAFAPSLTQQR